jgi:hypothetical protein
VHSGPYFSVVDVDKGVETLRLEKGGSAQVEVSADGRWVEAYGGRAPHSHGWRLPTGEPQPSTVSQTGPIGAVALRAGRLYTGGDDGTVLAWDVAKGNVVGRAFGGDSAIRSIEVSSKNQVAVANSLGQVFVYDSTLRKPLYAVSRPNSGYGAPLIAIAFSPDASLLAVSDAQSILMVDTVSGSVVRQAVGSRGSALTFTSDGQWLVAGCAPLAVTHVATGRRVLSDASVACSEIGLVEDRYLLLGAHGVSFGQGSRDLLWAYGSAPVPVDGLGARASFSHDGRLVASIFQGLLVVRDTATLRPLSGDDLPKNKPDGQTKDHDVSALRFASDSYQIALAVGNTAWVTDSPALPGGGAQRLVAHAPMDQLSETIADIATLRRGADPVPAQVKVVREPLRSGAFWEAQAAVLSPNAKQIVFRSAASSNALFLVNVADGATTAFGRAGTLSLVQGFAGPQTVIGSCAVSEDALPQLCKVDRAAPDAPQRLPSKCSAAAVAPNDDLVCMGEWGSVLMRRDRAVGLPLPAMETASGGGGADRVVVATPDASTLVEMVPGRLRVDRVTPKGLTAGRTVRLQPMVDSLALSNDGNLLALVGADTAWVRAIGDWSVRAILCGQQGIQRAAFSPDGQRVATSDREGTVRIWEVEKGALIEILESQRPVDRDLGFSDDGTKVVTVGSQGQWDLWGL